jgi:hypothetical protein
VAKKLALSLRWTWDPLVSPIKIPKYLKNNNIYFFPPTPTTAGHALAAGAAQLSTGRAPSRAGTVLSAVGYLVELSGAPKCTREGQTAPSLRASE